MTSKLSGQWIRTQYFTVGRLSPEDRMYYNVLYSGTHELMISTAPNSDVKSVVRAGRRISRQLGIRYSTKIVKVCSV